MAFNNIFGGAPTQAPSQQAPAPAVAPIQGQTQQGVTHQDPQAQPGQVAPQLDAQGNPLPVDPSLQDPNNFDINGFMNPEANPNTNTADDPNQWSGMADFVRGIQQMDTNNNQGGETNFQQWYQENMGGEEGSDIHDRFDALFTDPNTGEVDADSKKAFFDAQRQNQQDFAEKIFTNTATMAKNLIEKMMTEKMDGFESKLTQQSSINKMNEKFPFTGQPMHSQLANQMLEKALPMANGNLDAALGMVEGYYRSTNPQLLDNSNISGTNNPLEDAWGGGTKLTGSDVAALFSKS